MEDEDRRAQRLVYFSKKGILTEDFAKKIMADICLYCFEVPGYKHFRLCDIPGRERMFFAPCWSFVDVTTSEQAEQAG